ncbi:MAG: ABC transporter ATP-binding protein [Gemmatimonadota bacterium]
MSHLRTLLPYFGPYRTAMSVGLALVVVSNLFTVAAPWLLRLAVDHLGSADASPGRLAGYAGLIVLAAVLGGAARFGMRELLNGVSRRVECDLRAHFFRHLVRLDAGFFGRERTGDIMSRATHDTLAVRQAAGPAVMYAVNTVVVTGFALSVMIWISPALTALVLIPMALLPPVVITFGRVIHRRFLKIQEQFSALSTQAQENLTGVRLIRGYAQEADQADRFGRMSREYMERNLHLVRVEGLFHPSLGLLTGAAMVVLLWFGGGRVMSGALTIGDLVAFLFYVNLLTWPMIALGWVVNLFQRGEASMARINAILRTEPEIVTGRGRSTDQVRGHIEFRGVHFRHPREERDVLRDLSFVVEAGETVAIVGATGSGKSTLVSLLPRLFDPTDGMILLDGIPLQEYDPARLRAVMGVVPQDAFLFSDTIASNVGLGLADADSGAGRAEIHEIDARILRAAEIAQLDEQVRAFPKRYQTRLGERGVNLSGGQRQRATLARALAREPKILILDDALSAVDTQTEADILSELAAAMRARTSFLVSHRVTAVERADRILVLEEGRLVETGTPEELRERGGVYAALLRRQLLQRDFEEGVLSAARREPLPLALAEPEPRPGAPE